MLPYKNKWELSVYPVQRQRQTETEGGTEREKIMLPYKSKWELSVYPVHQMTLP
jgi:hypothetical protein